MTFYSEEHVESIRRQGQRLKELHRQHREERTGEVTDRTETKEAADIDIPVEFAGKDLKHTNPIHTTVPDSMLEDLPQHVGKLIPDAFGWVHVKSFLVHRESGEVFISKKALALKTMPKNQYNQWAYIRRMNTGGYLVSMLPKDFLYTITYDTPDSDTHVRVTQMIFRVKASGTPVA